MKKVKKETEKIEEKREKIKKNPPTEEQMKEFNKVWEDIDEISIMIEKSK